MADTQTATAAPELETPERDWSALGAELGDEPETVADAPPTETPTEPAVPASTDTQTPEPTDDDLKALDALIAQDKAAPVVEDKPTVEPATPEVQTIQQWSKNPTDAREIVGAVQAYVHLDTAANAGNFKGIVESFAPPVQEGLKDYLYSVYKEEFAQRFIQETDGSAVKADPRVSQLEARLVKAEALLTERQKQELQYQQSQKVAQAKQGYDNCWKTLFDAVHVTEPKHQAMLRGWVLDELSKNPKAAANIRAGRYGDITMKFRDVYKDWNAERKASRTATADLRTQQENKKTGQLATAAPSSGAPTDEPDHDEDGKRTAGFWKRNLGKIGL